jgi:uncharacterized repeat protein (TIGR02543 family)
MGSSFNLIAQEFFNGTIVLGRPTNSSITVNIHSYNDLDVYLEYGTEFGVYNSLTELTTLESGNPLEIEITGLQSSTQYHYRLRYRQSGSSAFNEGESYTFHTQRQPGDTFTFVIQADPHNKDFNSSLYQIAMQNTLNDNPDFLIDIGDNFMTEKLCKDVSDDRLESAILETILDLRPYYGIVGPSVPLYLAIGNHDGELGWLLDNDADNIAVYSRNFRKEYYPNPIPDPAGFYSGGVNTHAYAGLDDGYYSWEWGDALFVVLDPFWHTRSKPETYTDNADNGWDWTLGEEQYYWFKEILEQSDATFKFVFIHNLVGGMEKEARGGIESADYYEWGGKDINGNEEWDEKRGWEGGPIHDLMVANGVNALFHGHDHLFGLQELDCIVYQECPRPNLSSYASGAASETYYNVANTVLLPNSGHLRITVSPTEAKVDYVRAFLEGDGDNGKVAYSYTIYANDYESPLDDDQDGAMNDVDNCPDTPLGESVDANGCSDSQLSFYISVSVSPENSGLASGAGTYNYGETVNLNIATVTGYNFVNWTRDETEVSTDETYSFTVTENLTLVANFDIATDIVTTSEKTSSIYPNPASMSITISGVYGEVEIYNSIGNLVWIGEVVQNQNLDISNLTPGVYIIKIGTIIEKIIITD